MEGHIWNILCANFGDNWFPEIGFRAKKLKCQFEVQTALAARKLITDGGIQFSNLEVPGNAFSAPKFKL